jgi:hypothetical protein
MIRLVLACAIYRAVRELDGSAATINAASPFFWYALMRDMAIQLWCFLLCGCVME